MKVEFLFSKIKYILLSLPFMILFSVLNIVFIPRLIKGIRIQSSEEILFCLMMIFIFLIIGIFGVLIALQSKNNLTLKDDFIEGYYHGKIKIYYKDIECIATRFEYRLPKSNEISFLLYNGKNYHIKDVSNIDEVYKKAFISSPNLAKDYENIKQRKEKTAKATKIYYILIASLIVVMFVAIFVCVGLTGARDIPDFTDKDKIIFTCFIIFEFLIIITAFLVAILGAKYVRNKWSLLTSVKYKFDYSVRLVICKHDEETDMFVVERYVENSWRACSCELEYNNENMEKYAKMI